MTAVAPGERIRLGELWIDAVTFAGALREIERLVGALHGGVVFTPNVDHLVIAAHDESFRRAYASADLVVADGTPVLWAARLGGTPLPEKISGSDLVAPIARASAARGWRVYIVGGAPGVAARAAERLHHAHGVNIVGTDSPAVSAAGVADDEAAVIVRIRAADPHVLLVAFGSPKQELWIGRVAASLAPAVILAVGAGIDFAAGVQVRAPRWISRIGLEWAFRLVREPRRLWRRYLVDDAAIVVVVLRMLRIPRAERVRPSRVGA